MKAYLFVFDSEARAKIFVERLAHYLRDVAAFRDGPEVHVFDGAETQGEEIRRLARSSSAARAVVVTIDFDAEETKV